MTRMTHLISHQIGHICEINKERKKLKIVMKNHINTCISYDDVLK